MKKICFIVSSPTSINSFFKTNFEEISQIMDIYVVANFGDKSIFKDLNIADAFPVGIERRPSIVKDIKSLWKLYCYFKKMKFDAFVSMSSKASLLSSTAGFFARIPIRIRIFTGQIWANKTGVGRAFYKGIDKYTVTLNTHSLVDGKPQMQYLEENGILKQGSGRVLANGSICGVDVEKFKPSSNIREAERKKFGIKDDEIVFSFMGRLRKEKGILELFEAFNELLAVHDRIKLVLIGNCEDVTEDSLKTYSRLRIGDNVIIYGYTSKPFEALQIADVFCLPSYREGFGMSAIEAAALELPVICSDAYGLRDSFINGETGLECKVKDAISLKNCMQRFIENKELLKQYGTAGRKRIIEKFRKEIVAGAWKHYLDQLINK